ncbi:hypothetical protein [Rubellimicrobium aerolatum]|uniref:hypothetical protein n=1 Tax=Rubellimicrobium aerolatum TaxID=490979 RepID=UPI001AE2912A|nr:hypothetical protein [Rubellimicrobium aerolatum]MBP1807750.1 hypothetical protein [Rubellimicrobium aerolatum]
MQIRAGCILVDPQPSGAYLFDDATQVIASLRALRERTVEQVDLRAHQPAQEGHQHG